MAIEFLLADYRNERHARDLIHLLDEYAGDPMGGGKRLSPAVKLNLAQKLAELPHARSLLCYVDGKPAALANCFLVFSTFKCQPVINIHDLFVAKQFRGQQLSQRLLIKIEALGRKNDCCKITLEVLEGNEPAKNAYIKFGFSGYELDPALGRAVFWEKPIA